MALARLTPRSPASASTGQITRDIERRHDGLLAELQALVDGELANVRAIALKLHHLNRIPDEAQLERLPPIARQAVMAAVTDAHLIIRRALDQRLAEFYGVSIQAIERRTETVDGRTTYAVTVKKSTSPS